MRSWADDAAWFEIAVASLALNIATVLSSVALWRLLVTHRSVGGVTRPLVGRDIGLTASTTAVNAAVAFPAWWLWREGVIELPDPTLGGVLFDVVVLIVGIDVVMYVVHRIFHQGLLYRWFHVWHHTGDERMSPLTLFVMHPLEGAGFGVATLALLWVNPTSVVAISLFFTFNLIIGTVAHVPPRADASAATEGWLGGSPLHAGHHARPDTNFGFFTQVWDRLLSTRT